MCVSVQDFGITFRCCTKGCSRDDESKAFAYLPVGSSPCMLPMYLKLGFASSMPGLEEISSPSSSTPWALLPMLKSLLMDPHLDDEAKSRRCCSYMICTLVRSAGLSHAAFSCSSSSMQHAHILNTLSLAGLFSSWTLNGCHFACSSLLCQLEYSNCVWKWENL